MQKIVDSKNLKKSIGKAKPSLCKTTHGLGKVGAKML